MLHGVFCPRFSILFSDFCLFVLAFLSTFLGFSRLPVDFLSKIGRVTVKPCNAGALFAAAQFGLISFLFFGAPTP